MLCWYLDFGGCECIPGGQCASQPYGSSALDVSVLGNFSNLMYNFAEKINFTYYFLRFIEDITMMIRSLPKLVQL